MNFIFFLYDSWLIFFVDMKYGEFDAGFLVIWEPGLIEIR